MASRRVGTAVQPGVQNQLARLFGASSREARKTQRTPVQWKATLRKVLRELDQYIRANIDTDELHHSIIATGFLAANESLKQDDFWPGYTEGVTRVLVALLGDCPDHRRRKAGKKSMDHYRLNLHRSVHYTRDAEQRFRTLIAAGVFGLPDLSVAPRDVLMEFREQFGSKPTHRQFMRWYKKHFPADYTAVFS